MAPLRSFCIIYDSTCGLCTGVKRWLENQEQLVPLEFAASSSAAAGSRFPGLPAGELAVVANTGEAWLGNRAWIVCLWALRDYRDWANRFSSPLLLPLAKQAFAAVSRNRATLSKVLGARTDEAIERELRNILVTGCETKQE